MATFPESSGKVAISFFVMVCVFIFYRLHRGIQVQQPNHTRIKTLLQRSFDQSLYHLAARFLRIQYY